MDELPNRPVPLGCAVATAGLIGLVLAGGALLAAHRALLKVPPDEAAAGELRSYAWPALAVGVAATAWGLARVLLRLGVKERSRCGDVLTD